MVNSSILMSEEKITPISLDDIKEEDIPGRLWG